jgi:hypothetical protein
MIGSIVSAFFAICMALMVFSVLSSGDGSSAGNLYNAFWWGFGALAFGYGCPWLWKLSRGMAVYKVMLDSRGVNFNLGTKKKPSDLFLGWDQIASIKHKRLGNAQNYYVLGKDGNEAIFSSYTLPSARVLRFRKPDRRTFQAVHTECKLLCSFSAFSPSPASSQAGGEVRCIPLRPH